MMSNSHSLAGWYDVEVYKVVGTRQDSDSPYK
jgi:hypothetical protein